MERFPHSKDHGGKGLAYDASAGRDGHGVRDGIVTRINEGDEVRVCDVGEEGV